MPLAILARGRRFARFLFRKNKRKLIYFFLNLLTYLRTYFCFYLAKCQSAVCVVLFSNAIDLSQHYIAVLDQNHCQIPKFFCSYHKIPTSKQVPLVFRIVLTKILEWLLFACIDKSVSFKQGKPAISRSFQNSVYVRLSSRSIRYHTICTC